MRFVNRKSTPEDNEEFRVPQVWAKYHRRVTPGDPVAQSRSITVSDDHKIALLQVMQGYGEHGNRIIFVLIIGKYQVEVQLDSSNASSVSLSERPFRQVWRLASIKIPTNCEIASQGVVAILKDALSVYGYRGAEMQVPDTEVIFEF